MEVKPGYKATDVGVIPKDWDVLPLHSACDRISVGLATSVTKHYRASGVPLVRNLNIKNGYFDGSDIVFVSTDFAHANVAKAARPSDVLTVRTGANLGNTCLLPPTLHMSQTFTTLITTPNAKVLIPRYLCLHMSSFMGRKEMDRLQVGGGKGNLNTGHLKRYRIAVPPVYEQEAIVEALSDADALVESLEQLVAKKRQIKQGAMQELLTGKKRLAGFSGNWETFHFDQLFTLLRNASNSRSELSEYGDVTYIHYGDIHTHQSAFLNPATLQTFIASDKVRTIPRLADGDLLMVDASEDTTAIGKAVEIIGLNGSEAVAGLHTMAFRSNKACLAAGFAGYIQYLPKVRAALVRLATGVSVYGITKSGVRFIKVIIPKPAEQTAIAAVLSDMEAEIAGLEAKLVKARQVKQGMMQELLTGKTRLV